MATQATMSIRDFAVQNVDRLLTSLVFALHQAARTKDPDSIHDLRVGVRRFTQSLLIFGEFFPAAEVKRIRRGLKKLMRLSSEVRNRDIALEFLSTQEQPSGAREALVERLTRERSSCEEEFTALLERWRGHEFSARWRAALLLR